MSRHPSVTARHNIALAFGYNIIAMPVAVAGFATRLLAALVMATCSLVVICNALPVGRR